MTLQMHKVVRGDCQRFFCFILSSSRSTGPLMPSRKVVGEQYPDASLIQTDIVLLVPNNARSFGQRSNGLSVCGTPSKEPSH